MHVWIVRDRWKDIKAYCLDEASAVDYVRYTLQESSDEEGWGILITEQDVHEALDGRFVIERKDVYQKE